MTNEQAANELKNYHREDGTVPEEITLAIQALETGEVYMTGEDYNLYMEGYKSGLSDGRKDAERTQGEWLKDCENCDCNNCYESGHRFIRKDCSGTCSVCGVLCCCTDNYCPNCGARMMKGGTEE